MIGKQKLELKEKIGNLQKKGGMTLIWAPIHG